MDAPHHDLVFHIGSGQEISLWRPGEVRDRVGVTVEAPRRLYRSPFGILGDTGDANGSAIADVGEFVTRAAPAQTGDDRRACPEPQQLRVLGNGEDGNGTVSAANGQPI